MNISDSELILELEKRIVDKQKALVELNNVTRQLLEVNEKLAESEALKTHFISNITNELVNPFSSIMGLSMHIAEAKPADFEKIKGMALLIHDEAFSLDFQLKNIFAAAAIEAGEMCPEYSNVNVSSVINSVIEAYRHLMRKRKIIFENNNQLDKAEITFKTDADKLQLIVSNLISNAINFSSQDSLIVLNVQIEDNNLHLSVKDNGIGIQQKDFKVIFDRFSRLDTTINSVKRGHGLGLSVVKAYIDLLNGDIQVESNEAIGSVFTIILPEAQVDDMFDQSEGNEIFFAVDDEVF